MNKEDGLTPEDWARYGGGYYSSYSSSSSSYLREDDDYDDKGKEEEDEDVTFKKPLSYSSDFVSKNTTNSRKKRVLDPSDPVVREIEREPENVEQILKMAGGRTGIDAPIQEIEFNKRVIPYEIQHSASVLLEAHQSGDIRLGYEALENIKKLADCADEFTEIDPKVVIYDTFSTEVCKIYVKEVVPISILLLARHFGLEYSIQITKDLESNPRPFRDVKVKPFHGDLVVFNHVQSLGCEEAVKQRMQNNSIQWNLVRMYMIRVGPQSAANLVGDFEWFEAQTRAIGSVLQRQAPKQEYRKPPTQERIQKTQDEEEGFDFLN